MAINELHLATPKITVILDYFAQDNGVVWSYVDLVGTYLGAVIRKAGTTSGYSTTISTTAITGTEMTSPSVGAIWNSTVTYTTYEVFPFLARKSLVDPNIVETYYALEGGKQSLVHTQNIVAFLQGKKNSNIISYTLTITNNTSTAITVQNAYVYTKYFTSSSDYWELQDGEGSLSLGTITVPANSTIVKEGVFASYQSLPNESIKGFGYLLFICSAPSDINNLRGDIEKIP